MKKSLVFLLPLYLLFGWNLAFGQAKISLISHLPKLDTTSRGTDLWGYVDPNTGKEYILFGSFNTVSVIDVSDPMAPEYVAFLPNVKGFDIKVWGNHAYCVGGNGEVGQMNILDLTDPTQPVVVGNTTNAHNIWIDDQGYLYAAHKGIKIYDLNPNPAQPQLVWQDTTLGGHDIAVFGNRIYFFEGYNGTFIYEAPDRSNPQLITQITDPGIQYHHSGWVKDNTLYICDELAKSPTADITVWDITDIQNPTKIDEFEDGESIVHNIYIKGSTAFVSYYKKGFRVFDVQSSEDLKLLDTYATYTGTLDETFDGAFGVYPFSPSGKFMVNDMSNGFFLFDVAYLPENAENGVGYPNPFTDWVRMVVNVEEETHSSLEVFDTRGRKVAVVYEGRLPPGQYWFEWDGHEGGSNAPAAAGIYYLRYTEYNKEHPVPKVTATVIKQP